MLKKLLPAIVILMMIGFASHAQKARKSQEYDAEKHAFHVHQHVMVTMKNGQQKEAVIHGHVSKKKYYVREYHSRLQGTVHERYIRALSEGEIETLKNAKKK